MTVNYEIKGMLAKLLSTEDIIVEQKNVETACFNVHTRVLTLPTWKASNTVVDLLVAHECGHSIYTDDIDWSKGRNLPQQYVNVTEDARVEKLMRRRYAGLSKTFYNGYKQLYEEDFFSIGNDDISKYNLADRANLYFKIGSHLNLQFTEEEREIIDLIDSAETFEDAINAAEVLYNYCKINYENSITIQDLLKDSSSTQCGNIDESSEASSEQLTGGSVEQLNSDDTGTSQDCPPSQQPSNSGDLKNHSNTESKDEPGSSSNIGSDKPSHEDLDVKTVKSLEDSIKELVDSSGSPSVYLEIPDIDLNQIIIDNSKIHDTCKKEWKEFLERSNFKYEEAFLNVDSDYRKFKNSAQKEVNYLVKEFECKKAADSYSRAKNSVTGVLDCSKIHTYKFNEDLFKKVTVIPNGKNHGLIFILDWSGSMSRVMLDTIKQLYSLIWFCKKVSIPFEVYAFTYDFPKHKNDNQVIPIYHKKEGVFQIPEYVSLMNIFTSKVKSSTLDEQMINIYRLAKAYGQYYVVYPIPTGMTLSGTPLNESVICLHKILPKFQKENKLQKVQCVILTDGEASQLKYHKEFNRKWENEPYIGIASFNPETSFIRDKKTGNTYSLNVDWYKFTDVLLKNLRDKFPSVNFIGMRVLDTRDFNGFVRRYCNYGDKEYDNVSNLWKKEKTFSIKTSGYHSYFGISSSSMSNNDEFSVAEDATKSQIKNAFVKSLKNKKMNKKILNEFISYIV